MFQATVCLQDYESPPHFLKDRASVREMTLIANTHQYRDGRERLPTPEKAAIMNLSTSFEKRRLGKQQQILTDITQRCREQEVSDLSNKMSNKLTLQKNAPMDREMTFYSTNYMLKKPKASARDGRTESVEQEQVTYGPEARVPKPVEKTYKYFPARKIIKQPTKFDFTKVTIVPQGKAEPDRGLESKDGQSKVRILHAQAINPQMPLDHFLQEGEKTAASITLPHINVDTGTRDQVDAYFSSSRLAIGPRTRTICGPVPDMGSASNRSFKSMRSTRSLKPIRLRSNSHHLIPALHPGDNTPAPIAGRTILRADQNV